MHKERGGEEYPQSVVIGSFYHGRLLHFLRACPSTTPMGDGNCCTPRLPSPVPGFSFIFRTLRRWIDQETYPHPKEKHRLTDPGTDVIQVAHYPLPMYQEDL